MNGILSPRAARCAGRLLVNTSSLFLRESIRRVWFADHLQYTVPVAPTQDTTDIHRKQAAERAIEDAGQGICKYCAEIVVKNETLADWESEFMLAYCNEAKDHRHHPLLRYVPMEGVVNVERDDPSGSEPLQGEGNCV